MRFVYEKAIKSIKEHPTRLANGTEAKKLKHVGDFVARVIDEELGNLGADGDGVGASSSQRGSASASTSPQRAPAKRTSSKRPPLEIPPLPDLTSSRSSAAAPRTNLSAAAHAQKAASEIFAHLGNPPRPESESEFDDDDEIVAVQPVPRPPAATSSSSSSPAAASSNGRKRSNAASTDSAAAAEPAPKRSRGGISRANPPMQGSVPYALLMAFLEWSVETPPRAMVTRADLILRARRFCTAKVDNQATAVIKRLREHEMISSDESGKLHSLTAAGTDLARSIYHELRRLNREVQSIPALDGVPPPAPTVVRPSTSSSASTGASSSAQRPPRPAPVIGPSPLDRWDKEMEAQWEVPYELESQPRPPPSARSQEVSGSQSSQHRTGTRGRDLPASQSSVKSTSSQVVVLDDSDDDSIAGGRSTRRPPAAQSSSDSDDNLEILEPRLATARPILEQNRNRCGPSPMIDSLGRADGWRDSLFISEHLQLGSAAAPSPRSSPPRPQPASQKKANGTQAASSKLAAAASAAAATAASRRHATASPMPRASASSQSQSKSQSQSHSQSHSQPAPSSRPSSASSSLSRSSSTSSPPSSSQPSSSQPSSQIAQARLISTPPPPAPPAVPTWTPFRINVLPPNSYDVVLLVDHREFASKGHSESMARYRNEFGVHVEQQALAIGDMLWVARPRPGTAAAAARCGYVVLDYIAERKRLDDLYSSINDKRWYEQKARMQATALPQITYLVEAEPKNHQVKDNDESKRKAAVTATTKVVAWHSMNLQTTRSADETVALIAQMTKSIARLWAGRPVYYLSSNQFRSADEWAQFKSYGCVDPADGTLRPVSADAADEFCNTAASIDRCVHSPHLLYEDFQALFVKQPQITVHTYLVKQLMMVNGVTAEKATFIANYFKTPRALRDNYQALAEDERGLFLSNWSEDYEKEKQVRLTTQQKIGQAVSIKIAELFCKQR
ncbi:Crossover junction endonuclease mus81 [Blastocladiella emersonii ATCC 22665]|nr:Crossover junction endonuclease mus81 [Blastocladiella emersonii ATCC 22665]